MNKKNKFKSLLAITGLLLTSTAANAATGSWTSGSTTVVLTDDNVLTISGTGAMSYAYYSSNNVPWRYSKSFIKTVVINEGVTHIAQYAFSDCIDLTSVTIPNSMTSIGSRAFHNCSGLISVSIPNSVTSIGEYAFVYCIGLTSVTIPNSVTSIGEYAFSGCYGLDSVSVAWATPLDIPNNVFDFLPNTVQLIVPEGAATTYAAVDGWKDFYIAGTDSPIAASGSCGSDLTWELTFHTLTISGTGAMYDFTYQSRPWYSFSTAIIKTLVINEGVTSIGQNAFISCSGLTSVTIPNSMTSIGDAAFRGCIGLTSITIPNSATSIGNSAFEGSGLTSVTIPGSVIGEGAFRDCGSLTSVIIGDGVTSIGDYAFSGCSSLTSVTIPDGVTSIGNYAFSGCSSLTSVTIPDGVTSIESCVFFDCSGLTSVTIGNSVTSIGSSAFRDCSGLTSVTIGNSVTSIGDMAFYDCSGLTSVTIPNSVTSIGGYAFHGCSGLTSVTISNNVTSIGSYAFSDCIGLTSVTCLATTPPTNSSDSNFKVLLDTLYVLANSLNSYKSNNGWNYSFERIFAGVALDKSTDTLAVDGSVQLIATVAPGIANTNVTWSNRNTAVATVSNSGLVTAVAVGTDTITVTTADGVFTATCVVTVNIPVTDVTLNKATASLSIGDTEPLTATIAPTDATNKNVTWNSSDMNVATVDNTGLVTAVAAGTADITVTTEDGSKTATCVVTVSIPVTDVTLNKATTSLTIGDTEPFTATFAPTDATNKNVSWTSSDNVYFCICRHLKMKKA
ncbi:leucine-rich repeat protein [Candidatus Symbiothrix dinenymphae]|uniref:leucine-rich repeat protein n=1 Tax=Candidatus Symbiothrix dinenymphae TaxID=467085 RepID=UPI00070343AC|nr:leucine-rich repeat protein [Candidatus Symbiothrix dinenymphae]